MGEIKPHKASRFCRHYHWIVFVTVFIVYMLYAGVANNCYSLFLLPVTGELGISRSAFSLYSTLACFPAFCSNLIFPRIYERVGYRKLATIVLIVNGGMLLWYSRAQGIAPFYVGATMFAFFTSFINTAGISRILSDWFHRYRGLLLGIVLSASGIGGSLGSVLLAQVIERYGWRAGYLASVGAVLLGAALVFLLVRDTPEEMGLTPFGEETAEQHTENTLQTERAEKRDGIMLSVLKKRAHFYVMLLVLMLSIMGTYIIHPTLVVHAQDLGMSMSQAARLQSLMFLFLAGAKVLEGALSDRFGARKVMAVCMMCGVISAVILAEAASYASVVVGVVIFSFALAEASVMLPILAEDVYGMRDRSAIVGVLLAGCRLATGFGPTLGNLACDIVGSYTPVYYAVAAVTLGCLFLFLLAVRGAEREKGRILQENAQTPKT